MLPGQNGKIVATFISTRTSPAAGRGRSRSNASITAQTANSCISQPRHWNDAAPSAGIGARSTASPWRAIVTTAPRLPMPSWTRPVPEPAETRPTVRRTNPTTPKMTRLVTAQCGNLRREQHPGDENRHREEIEEPVGEDGAEEGGARALPVGKMSSQDGDAGQLAGARGKHSVSEQADPEGREDMPERRVRRRQRLVDRQPPRERAGQDREQVEQDSDDHPAPGDEVEGVVDRRPLGAAPPDRDDRPCERGEDEETSGPRVPRESGESLHAACTPAPAIARS